MFGKNRIKQDVIIITPQGHLEEDKLEVGTLCFASPATFEAWELDYNQQAKGEGRKGKLTQFVSSLNKQPLKIYPNRVQSKSTASRDIAAQQFDEKLVQINKRNDKNGMLLWLGIFMMGLLLMITILVWGIVK